MEIFQKKFEHGGEHGDKLFGEKFSAPTLQIHAVKPVFQVFLGHLYRAETEPQNTEVNK